MCAPGIVVRRTNSEFMMLRLKVRWVGSLLGLFYLLILLAPVTRLQAQPAVPPDGAPVITPPPRFDPAQLGRGEPLPGNDYPAAAATPLPDTGAAATEHNRPDGIDLEPSPLQGRVELAEGRVDVEVDDALGFTLQAGVDIEMGQGWYLNADFKKVWIGSVEVKKVSNER